jgi:hypothetical protein
VGVAVGQIYSVSYTSETSIPNMYFSQEGAGDYGRFDKDLQFPKFDPSSGTLQSVVLTLSGSATAVIRQQVFDPTLNLAGGSISMMVYPTDRSDIGSALGLIDGSLPGVAFGFFIDLSGPQIMTEQTFGPKDGASSSLAIPFSDAGTLSAFTGCDRYILPLTGVANLIPNDLAHYYVGVMGISATVNVTYLYTLVPEPSAYAAVVGFGLFGFAVYRKSRRSL